MCIEFTEIYILYYLEPILTSPDFEFLKLECSTHFYVIFLDISNFCVIVKQ